MLLPLVLCVIHLVPTQMVSTTHGQLGWACFTSVMDIITNSLDESPFWTQCCSDTNFR